MEPIMFARFVAAGAALLISVAAALAADPTGKYVVRGTYPGGGNYSGTVVVERTGNAYRVTWVINGQTIVGTGVATPGVDNPTTFAAYRPGNQSAVLVYEPKTIYWDGVWTYANGSALGTEYWR
jgi:hypothetical protein